YLIFSRMSTYLLHKYSFLIQKIIYPFSSLPALLLESLNEAYRAPEFFNPTDKAASLALSYTVRLLTHTTSIFLLTLSLLIPFLSNTLLNFFLPILYFFNMSFIVYPLL